MLSRIFLCWLMFLLLLMIESKGDSFPSLIQLNVTKFDINGDEKFIFVCRSLHKPVDYSAEFIKDGKTLEHVQDANEECLTSKRQICQPDYCSCLPFENAFSLFLTVQDFQTNSVFGCQMRFTDAEKGGHFRVFVSLIYNGKDFSRHEYDIKNYGEGENEGNDNKPVNTSWGDLTIWSPVGISVGMGIILVVCICLCRIDRSKRRKEPTLKLSESFCDYQNCFQCHVCGLLAVYGICGQCSNFYCMICSNFHLLSHTDHTILPLLENICKDTVYKCSICNSRKSARVCTKCRIVLCNNCECMAFDHRHWVKMLRPGALKPYTQYRDYNIQMRQLLEPDYSMDMMEIYGGEKPVHVCSFVILDSKNIVIADSNNKLLMLFRLPTYPISSLMLEDEPRCMTRMSCNRIAVIFANKREIVIFQIMETIIQQTPAIPLSSPTKLFNICYDANYFAVGTGEAEDDCILILNHDFKQKNKIIKKKKLPFFIGKIMRLALDGKKERLYVTAVGKRAVTCLDFKGNVIWSVPCSDPTDILSLSSNKFQDKTIIVSCKQENAVYLVNSLTGTFEPITSIKEIKFPQHLSYDPVDDILAVQTDTTCLNIYRCQSWLMKSLLFESGTS